MEPDRLSKELTANLDAARMTAEALSLDAQLARDTVGRWIRGTTVPTLAALLAVEEVLSDRLGCQVDLAAAQKERRSARHRKRLSADGAQGVATQQRILPRGRPISSWDPVSLGVHRAIGGSPLSSYVRRPHDDLLCAVLDPGQAANRLLVIRGGSSTGKSRAGFEAVKVQLPNWRLDYPRTPAALEQRLQDGIAPETVLWLDELRDFAEADGGAMALTHLAEMLDEDRQVVVIVTLWPEHWAVYTADRPRSPGMPDPAAATRGLLAPLAVLAPEQAFPGGEFSRGGVVDIPSRFTRAEVTRASEQSDAVLREAIEAARRAGSDGEITQYLAGAPDLLNHYQGPGADPYGQAIITAAMDAARLGHAGPYQPKLLQDAVTGYLTDQQRAAELPAWWNDALAYATEELKGTVRALEPVPPERGTGIVGYKLADYLEQYGRRSRQSCLGPATLWEALQTHITSLSYIDRVAYAAHARGLYRRTALLWTHAIALGSADAATRMIHFLKTLDPDGARRASCWAADQVDLSEPHAVSSLLRAMRDVGAGDAVTALLARDPAEQADLNSGWQVADLLQTLHDVGAAEAVMKLVSRVAQRSNLNHPTDSPDLLRALRYVGARDAVTALLARDPAERAGLNSLDAANKLASRTVSHVNVTDPWEVAEQLTVLRHAGNVDAANELASRAVNHVNLTGTREVVDWFRVLRAWEETDAVAALLARGPADHADLSDPAAVAGLLEGLQHQGESDAVTALLARDPASRVSLTDTGGVARFLEVLCAAGETDAVATLLARDPARSADLRDAAGVAYLLEVLRDAGKADTVAELLARDPAGAADIRFAGDVAYLLAELRAAGAAEAGNNLASRAADYTNARRPGAVRDMLKLLHAAGAADAVNRLASRAADHTEISRPGAIRFMLRVFRDTNAADAADKLVSRAVSHINLTDTGKLAELLGMLRVARETDAVAALLARDPARHADLSEPAAVARLLAVLHAAGKPDAVAALLARDPARHADLRDPAAVAALLGVLHLVGAAEAVTTLLARDPVGHADLGNQRAVEALLGALTRVGAADLVNALAIRAADSGLMAIFLRVDLNRVRGYMFGREFGDVSSLSWRWDAPNSE